MSPDKRYHLLLIFLLFSILSGACSTQLPQGTATPTATATARSPQPTTATPSPANSSQSVTLWLPPRFRADTPAGALLLEHLALFEQSHPDLKIHVRIKDETGTAGLLETLAAASSVAPAALPDIIAIDPAGLQSAALKGLIQPLDGLLPPPAAPDWYPWAVLAADIDGEFFGVPFIGEAQVFAYRKEDFEEEPRSWTQLAESKRAFLFPAGDPGALFTLAQYRALGGQLEDENSWPFIEQNLLSDIFSFYLDAQENGTLPLINLQLTGAQETFFTLQQQSFSCAVIPLEAFLSLSQDNPWSVMPWPTRSGSGVVPTNAWVWAVVTEDADRQALAIEMIEWLLTPEFLGAWAHSLGSFAATSEAMNSWPERANAAAMTRLLRVAVPGPSAEEKIIFGPAIQIALSELLNGRLTPAQAAQMVFDQIDTEE